VEKSYVIDTLETKILCFRKMVNDQYPDIHKQTNIKKQFSECWDTPHQWSSGFEKRRKAKFYKEKKL